MNITKILIVFIFIFVNKYNFVQSENKKNLNELVNEYIKKEMETIDTFNKIIRKEPSITPFKNHGAIVKGFGLVGRGVSFTDEFYYNNGVEIINFPGSIVHSITDGKVIRAERINWRYVVEIKNLSGVSVI
ncbi:MAG: hypothetical protein OEZ36_09860 [Spirochaetota bacterium]|nr:hypothetical protein [Spirochaetota bacterium]